MALSTRDSSWADPEARGSPCRHLGRVGHLEQMPVLGELAVIVGAEARVVLPDRPGAATQGVPAGVVRVEVRRRPVVIGRRHDRAVRTRELVAGRRERKRFLNRRQIGVEAERRVLDVVVRTGLGTGHDGRRGPVRTAVRPIPLVGRAVVAEVVPKQPLILISVEAVPGKQP